MIINKSVFKVVIKDGKFFVEHTFNGENFQNVEYMMVYGVNSKPYVKRLSTKMYLPEELLQELRKIAQ